jgi:hypothetical protein
MRGLLQNPLVEVVLWRTSHHSFGYKPIRCLGMIHDYARRGGFMLSVLARVLLVLLMAVTLTGCAAIAGIFKAGFWVGAIIAVIIVVVLFALFRRRG